MDVIDADDVVRHDVADHVVDVVRRRREMDERIAACSGPVDRGPIGERGDDHVGEARRRHEIEAADVMAAAHELGRDGPADPAAGAGEKNS